MLLLVGTYTSGESKSKGIYVLKFDPRDGAITPHGVVDGVEEPSFLAIDERRKFVYAVNETLEFNGQKSGSVSSFALRPDAGALTCEPMIWRMKASARNTPPPHHVTRVRSVAACRVPTNESDEDDAPPKLADRPLPFPDCSSTAAIRTRLLMTRCGYASSEIRLRYSSMISR